MKKKTKRKIMIGLAMGLAAGATFGVVKLVQKKRPK